MSHTTKESTIIHPHASALSMRHADLEAQIAHEQAKLRPDALKLQNLKRQKLAIKDTLEA